ncbi:MAG: DUF433 domain-containing protein [Acidobacteria bacterium]|nr:DUF433 domain-containing protein [Acidobacteriota bacterium]
MKVSDTLTWRNNLNFDIYDGNDPRELPAYTIPEGAQYLGIKPTTLRAWALGHRRKMGDGFEFKPVLRLPPGQNMLAFVNLVEAFVIDGLRRRHSVSLQKLRPAIELLETLAPDQPHPLSAIDLAVLDREVFANIEGQLISLTGRGQAGMKEILARFLSRVERDPGEVLASRFYPFVRAGCELSEPKAVMIDPRISFGRPVIRGTGVPTAIVAERFKAGESFAELSDDYGIEQAMIEDAIRCELDLAA